MYGGPEDTVESVVEILGGGVPSVSVCGVRAFGFICLSRDRNSLPREKLRVCYERQLGRLSLSKPQEEDGDSPRDCRLQRDSLRRICTYLRYYLFLLFLLPFPSSAEWTGTWG